MKAIVEDWVCTFEAGCDCPECAAFNADLAEELNRRAEEYEYNRIVQMHGCCTRGNCDY